MTTEALTCTDGRGTGQQVTPQRVTHDVEAGSAQLASLIVEELAERASDGESMAVVLGVLQHMDLVDDGAAKHVARAFNSCSAPSAVLEVDVWVRLFQRAGFSRDWDPVPAPTAARRLYRGARPAGVAGMCWSTEIDVARFFALGSSDGVVVSSVVEPRRQLAELGLTWEGFVVVDPIGLEFVVVESAAELVRYSRPELLEWIDERMEATS